MGDIDAKVLPEPSFEAPGFYLPQQFHNCMCTQLPLSGRRRPHEVIRSTKQIMSRKIRGKKPSNWICLYKPTHRCRSVVYCLCSQHFVVLKCQHRRREGAWGTMLEESSGTAWVSPPPCTARKPWALRPHWTSVPASSLGWGKPRGNPSTGFSIPLKNVDTTSKHEYVTCSYNSIL